MTGSYYMRARWYDPEVGRFVSEDPIGLAGGVNPYVYAGNDPVTYRDPSGLDPCEGKDLNGNGVFDDGDMCKIPGIDVVVDGGDGDPSGFSDNFGNRGFPRVLRAVGGAASGVADAARAAANWVDENRACIAAVAEFTARLVVDGALIYSYGSGAVVLGRGLLLVAEGHAISSGLILTATLKSVGSTGAAEMAAGRALLAAGTGSVGAAAASASAAPGISLLPTNAYNFARDGGFSDCQR